MTPWSPCEPCFFKTCQLKSWRSQAYRAVVRRRAAYAAMVRLGTPNFSSACFRKVKDGFAQRTQRTQWKHKPGVDSRKHISSLCPPCPPCPRCELFFKRCQLKSWRSQPMKSRGPSLYLALTPRCSCGLSRGKWFLRPRDFPLPILRRDDYKD